MTLRCISRCKNTELNKDIKYISSGSISDLMVDGKAADSISVSAMTVGVDGTITDSTKVTGSFTYVNDTLSLGDKIAVYEGDVIPSLDTETVTDDDVSFFEITSADDSRYTYRGLAAKEILFVPWCFRLILMMIKITMWGTTVLS